MSPAHDQQRRDQILSTHRRDRGRCGACGQSWPCTEREGLDPLRRPSRRRRVIATVVLVAAVAVLVVALVVGLADLLMAGASS